MMFFLDPCIFTWIGYVTLWNLFKKGMNWSCLSEVSRTVGALIRNTTMIHWSSWWSVYQNGQSEYSLYSNDDRSESIKPFIEEPNKFWSVWHVFNPDMALRLRSRLHRSCIEQWQELSKFLVHDTYKKYQTNF